MLANVLTAQIGINTTTPEATLDVVGEPNIPATADGIIAPRITGDQLRAKTAYGVAQQGALVYVTAADSAPAGQTINVTGPGYYFFNGLLWLSATSPAGATDNIYTANGTLAGNRVVTQAANTLAFTGTATNAFSVDGTTLSVDAANNRIGVGTTTPSEALSVIGNINTSRHLELGELGAGDRTSFIDFHAEDGVDRSFRIRRFEGTNGIVQFQNIGTGEISFLTDFGISRMTIGSSLNNGNVGIGIVNAEARLDVNGNARVRAIPAGAAADDVITTDANGNLRQRTAAEIVDAGGGLDADGDAWGVTGEDVTSNVSRTGNVTIANTNKQALTLQTTDNALSNGIAFQNSGAAYTWNIFREDAGSNNADLVFSGGGAENDPNNLPERMRIEQNGNVGIGTATPRAGLEILKSPVVGQNVPALSQAVDVANSDDYSLVLSNSDNATIGMVSGFTDASGGFDTYLQSRIFAANGAAQNLLLNPVGGNVVIGADTPANAVLSVIGTGNGLITENYGINVSQTDADGTVKIGLIKTSATNNSHPALMGLEMRSGNGGSNRISIGTQTFGHSSPDEILFYTDADADPSTDGVTGAGSDLRMNIATNGNVGIGDLIVPEASLDINGDARVRTIPAGLAADGVVTTDANGNLRQRTAAQIVAAGGGTTTNLYTANGTLAGNRVVTQGANTLAFTGTAANAFSVDGTTLSVNAATNRVGIGTTTPTTLLDLGTSIGRKLSLWDDGGVFYGFGIQFDRLNFFSGALPAAGPDMTLLRFAAGVGPALGIGTDTPVQKLHVVGNIFADGGNVLITGGSFIDDGITLTAPDYVFETYFNGSSKLKSDYSFKSLSEIEAFIKNNNHLPGIKSAYEIKEDGWDLSFASRFNLEKIEELFLHTINQEKEMNILSEEILEIKEENKMLRNELDEMKKMLKLLIENKK